MTTLDELPRITTRDGQVPRIGVIGGDRSQSLILTVLASHFGCQTQQMTPDEATGADTDLIIVDAADELSEGLSVPVLAIGPDEGAVEDSLGRFFSPRQFHAALRRALAEAEPAVAA